jgi:hypothetical protein
MSSNTGSLVQLHFKEGNRLLAWKILNQTTEIINSSIILDHDYT